MRLQGLSSAFLKEVHAERNTMRFKEAQQRSRVLAGYASPAVVLAALAKRGMAERAERSVLSGALVLEQFERPHPFWAALLLVAYTPMLVRLRGRIRAASWAADDLDQLVITAFLEVVATFAATQDSAFTSVFLQRTTARRVFTRLDRQRRVDRTEELCPHDWLAEMAVEGDQVIDALDAAEPDAAPETEALVDWLAEVAGAKITRDDLRLVAGTVLGGERLGAYVGRLHPQLDESQFVRMCQRLKRQRSRLMARLRQPLEGLRTDYAPDA